MGAIHPNSPRGPVALQNMGVGWGAVLSNNINILFSLKAKTSILYSTKNVVGWGHYKAIISRFYSFKALFEKLGCRRALESYIIIFLAFRFCLEKFVGRTRVGVYLTFSIVF